MPDLHITPTIISRQEAKALGLKHYYSGIPCKSGHLTTRNTHTSSCHECSRCGTKRYRVRNPKQGAEYMRRLRSDPEQKERLLAAERESYAKRKEHYRIKREKWKQANPDYSREYYKLTKGEHAARGRAWRKANPDKVRAIKQNRRAMERNAEGTFNAEDVSRIRHMQKNRCAICRAKLIDKPSFVHLDHIVALASGGTNWPRNLQMLCRHCNSQKTDFDQIDFMQSLGYLL